MDLNAIKDRHGITLHHEAALRPDAPKRDRGCREPVVDSSLAAYSGARADVVQREVAERVNDLASQRHGYDERSAVDYRSSRRSREIACVAHRTSNIGEQRGAGVYISRDWPAPGSPQSSHEIREGPDVFVAVVFGISYRVERSGGRPEDVILRG